MASFQTLEGTVFVAYADVGVGQKIAIGITGRRQVGTAFAGTPQEFAHIN